MLGSAVAYAAAATAREPDRDGWMRVTIPIGSIDHATFESRDSGPTSKCSNPGS